MKWWEYVEGDDGKPFKEEHHWYEDILNNNNNASGPPPNPVTP
jgi:hypothetical protein